MRLSSWIRTYRRIAAALSLDEERDASAAIELASILEGTPTARVEDLVRSVTGQVVSVWGAGPSLEQDLARAIDFGLLESTANFAADGAVTAFLESEKVPHMLFTDLDGPSTDLLKANSLGSLAVIHAHGDNLPALRRLTKSFTGKVFGSTQVHPIPPYVLNLGGFTDGDRAAHWAFELGASAIFLFGMDLGPIIGRYSKPDLSGEPLVRKLKKLEIAGDLLSSLSKQIQIYNFTSSGKKIPLIANASFSDLHGIMVKVKSH